MLLFVCLNTYAALWHLPGFILISTPTGKRTIDQIHIDDFVLTPQGIAKVLMISSHLTTRYLHIETEGPSLDITLDHLVYIADSQSWTIADGLLEGDFLLHENGHLRVLSITTVYEPLRVYSIQTQTFYANGFLVSTNAFKRQYELSRIKIKSSFEHATSSKSLKLP